jgi:tetratricopeptide (TPR) repeat protein
MTASPEGQLRDWGLVQVNAAEALYNLGCLRAARRRLDRAEAIAGRADGLVASGLRLNRAWLLALENQGEEALALADGVDPASLPPEYHAEIGYTRAFALLAQGRFDDARSAASEARKLAKRPSSERNGTFLLGLIDHRAGRGEDAIALFEEGAQHAYRDQGGDALFAWAEALEALGRPADAHLAYERVIDRDPESLAARRARGHLRDER